MKNVQCISFAPFWKEHFLCNKVQGCFGVNKDDVEKTNEGSKKQREISQSVRLVIFGL